MHARARLEGCACDVGGGDRRALIPLALNPDLWQSFGFDLWPIVIFRLWRLAYGERRASGPDLW